MLSLISPALIFSAIMACAFFATASPLARRQIGNVQCNVDRLEFVVGLQETSDQVDVLAAELGNTTFASAVTTAQEGIHATFIAADGIANAVFKNTTAPPELRGQVGGNITVIAQALSSINTTDSAANTTLQQALTLLRGAAFAADSVVEDCH
ncbi:hypothetical protein EW146_g2915 [Bondarzewia mesenterica]|uniref:Uncharacterized protein n=1 Tax=Bondarzewia mesenterica TaxID=1095465 RepID=A0A4S4LZF5_9AGAM|nr:hypothetical protein EW146_g2915 [Bondarzewia mesenterica]